jgi:hypothetical protein
MRIALLLLLLLALSGLACNRPSAPPVLGTPSTSEGRGNYPLKEEVIEYLDGKTINLADPKGKEKSPIVHKLRKNEIEALEIGKSASSFDNGPWSTDMTFIARTDGGRFALKGRVQYRIVENKCAFFGFEISEVARQ